MDEQEQELVAGALAQHSSDQQREVHDHSIWRNRPLPEETNLHLREIYQQGRVPGLSEGGQAQSEGSPLTSTPTLRRGFRPHREDLDSDDQRPLHSSQERPSFLRLQWQVHSPMLTIFFVCASD